MNQKKENTKTRSSKKIIPILAVALIVVGIILIVTLSDSKKEKSNIPYNPGNVEVEIVEGTGRSQISQPQTTGDIDMANKLGAATTGDIHGGSSGVQQGAGGTEEMLEGKEIKINK